MMPFAMLQSTVGYDQFGSKITIFWVKNRNDVIFIFVLNLTLTYGPVA